MRLNEFHQPQLCLNCTCSRANSNIRFMRHTYGCFFVTYLIEHVFCNTENVSSGLRLYKSQIVLCLRFSSQIGRRIMLCIVCIELKQIDWSQSPNLQRTILRTPNQSFACPRSYSTKQTHTHARTHCTPDGPHLTDHQIHINISSPFQPHPHSHNDSPERSLYRIIMPLMAI